MANVIDCMHMGRDRVIGAWEVRPGVIVDPGPASCSHTLLAGVEAEPRALLLSHIHLDHAGASGVLARRFPDLRVYVHEVGAPHVIDPSRLVASAGRLYGDQMETLWGEVAPVPAERVTVLEGGEEVEGLEVHYAPGHARHHVVYFDPASRDAYCGDVAGCPGAALASSSPRRRRRPRSRSRPGASRWRCCARSIPRGSASRTSARARTSRASSTGSSPGWRRPPRRASPGIATRFAAWLEGRFDAEGGEIAERLRQAMPPDQLWLGLERYWRKRREAEQAA